MQLKIVEKTKIWLAISLLIILAGLAVMATTGLNYGVDFAGGSRIYATLGQAFDVEDVRAITAEMNIPATVSYAGEDNQDVIIRTREIERTQEIQNALIERYGITGDEITIDSVGPTIGRELTANAIQSVLIASLLILIYVWIRFELKSGVAAIIALIHDVLIMFAAMAFFQVQINSPYVAAMLTIIGYSINDTIIIFDRIRENYRRFNRKMTRDAIVNKSVSETIVRSLNTSLTTLFVVTALYVLGVEDVREFAFPLIVGVFSGTYSSIFIAGPIWALWNDQKDKKKRPAAAE